MCVRIFCSSEVNFGNSSLDFYFFRKRESLMESGPYLSNIDMLVKPQGLPNSIHLVLRLQTHTNLFNFCVALLLTNSLYTANVSPLFHPLPIPLTVHLFLILISYDYFHLYFITRFWIFVINRKQIKEV